ncbi:MAG: hypothetical protein A2Y34_06555 [Spirochaetes bacterium GWC1_27_15]|nr:MAG: hypothetical protein A2Y34_06555 [Spirochaetes bacterium GWC1_27_15]
MKKNIKISLIIFIMLIFVSNINAKAFFGLFYLTDNYFDKNSFNTTHSFSFYLDNKFSDYVKFYTRLTAGVTYKADYNSTNDKIYNVSVMPSIDLLYFEFKSAKDKQIKFITNNGELNYDLFNLRFGRIPEIFGNGLIFNTIGDGLDLYFTIKNFRFKFFALTNSFDYLPFFDFIGSGVSKPVFTNWDRKRIPNFANYLIENNDNGFISDINSSDYNFYFKGDYQDGYSDEEKDRLNKLRKTAIIAGRIFSGFSFDIIQLYYQNFSLGFVANVDLIPEDFVITYPKILGKTHNTFGGKYNSFYINFNANGKIIKNLYYNFDFVYETGLNATYKDSSNKIIIENSLINAFLVKTGVTYFFDHKIDPTLTFNFSFASGDDDVEIVNDAIINKSDMDNNFKSITSQFTSYAVSPSPAFSNLIILELKNSIKPMVYLKNEIFSRFEVDSSFLVFLRPNIKGSVFYSQKPEYLKIGSKYESTDKVFVGCEIDVNLLWRIFSDLSLALKTGIFIPNYLIYTNNDLFFKVGLSLNVSI